MYGHERPSHRCISCTLASDYSISFFMVSAFVFWCHRLLGSLPRIALLDRMSSLHHPAQVYTIISWNFALKRECNELEPSVERLLQPGNLASLIAGCHKLCKSTKKHRKCKKKESWPNGQWRAPEKGTAWMVLITGEPIIPVNGPILKWKSWYTKLSISEIDLLSPHGVSFKECLTKLEKLD